MDFRQLKDVLNKWSSTIENEERRFLHECLKTNYYDRILMSNGDKITKINGCLAKSEEDFTEMEKHMEAIKGHQRDLANIVDMIESCIPTDVIIDPERLYVIKTSRSATTELEQMSEDLQEVAQHINVSHPGLERNDPVISVLKIMNEHTNTLQWLDDNTDNMKKSLDEVSKMTEIFCHEHGRNMNLNEQ